MRSGQMGLRPAGDGMAGCANVTRRAARRGASAAVVVLALGDVSVRVSQNARERVVLMRHEFKPVVAVFALAMIKKAQV